jgi:flavin reductase (DIM6/NTAB) family NADH-FMN oxidoreductase RutF
MKRIFALAAMTLALVACGNNQKTGESKANGEIENQEVKDVEGRRNFGSQHPLITPQPCIMIATYDANGQPDVMMAAWGGQCEADKIEFNLSPHKTTENLELKKAFTVSYATMDDIEESDFFGLVSAKDVPDKVERAGFTVTPSPNVDAPIINEYKLTLECKVVSIDKTPGGETHVVGQVVNWSADESILDSLDRVDLSKLKPIVFDGSAMVYREVGDSVGKAWGSGKKFQQ